jgi:hypothetical protein
MLYAIFHNLDFHYSGGPPPTLQDPNAVLSGKDFLNSAYRLRDVPMWPYWIVSLCWVALFRITHVVGFTVEVLPFIEVKKSVG